MFSNGTEYMDFNELFCCRCKKYVPDSEPGKGCPTEEALSVCSITGDKEDFPYKDLLSTGMYTAYMCKHFEGETPELQASYLEAVKKYGKGDAHD